MAKEFARSFYDSARWRKCRAAYISHRISIDGGLCEVCHQEQGYIVHHVEEITPENINDPDITLSFDNLRYECKMCHDREEGHFVKGTRSELQFDEDGNPWPLPPIEKAGLSAAPTGAGGRCNTQVARMTPLP